MRQALTVLWEAADRVCGKRLKALDPDAGRCDGAARPSRPGPGRQDQGLAGQRSDHRSGVGRARSHIDGQRKRRKGVGSAIRRSIPVRTFADWRDPPPGFFEIDMVEHCGGPKTEGDFVHTPDADRHRQRMDRMRGDAGARPDAGHRSASKMVAAELPFAMLGVDSDNDSAFMSQTVFDYCKGRGLEQTRSRAYKKNDQAWVEQKNGAVVRRLVGYGRLSGARPRRPWRSCTSRRGCTSTSSSPRSS